MFMRMITPSRRKIARWANRLQFYTGRDKQLYEMVVFNVTKNEISGYLATPK